MSIKKIIIWSGVVIVLGGVIFFLNSFLANTSVNQKFDRVPEFSLKDYSGNIVSLSDFSNKEVIVLNSWATWCPFCREELADFARAQKEFGDSVAIIAIDRAESLKTAKQYTDEFGLTNDILFLLDSSDSFYQSIGGFSMPETIFVDANGFIREHKRGPMKFEEIKEKVEQLLNF